MQVDSYLKIVVAKQKGNVYFTI